MLVAGVDYSSLAVDVVLIDADDFVAPEWFRFDLIGQDAFDRTRSVGAVMPSRGSGWWDDVLAIGIEHPAGKFGTGPMMRVQGAVLSMLPANVMVKPWPPGAWRKANGLPGNASKELVFAWSLQTRHGTAVTGSTQWTAHDRDDWPQDAHDAHLIALATRQALERQAAA